MLLKIAILLALFCIVWRWALGTWPWNALKPPPLREQEIAKARRLLSVSAVASREEIAAAHKRVIASVHPDRGGTSAAVHEANDARDLLLSDLPPEANPAGGSTQDGASSKSADD